MSSALRGRYLDGRAQCLISSRAISRAFSVRALRILLRTRRAATICDRYPQALAACETGDTLACWKLDRVGRRVSGAVAQFECDLIIERTRAGLAMARKNGKRLGPPIKWQPDMAKQARKLMKTGELTSQEVANILKVSRRTLFRGLKEAREHDELLDA